MSQNEEVNSTSEDKLLQLQALVSAENSEAVCAFFEDKSDTEIALLLESFPPNDRELIWQCVPEAIKGEVLAEVSEDIREDLMSEMAAEEVSELAKDLDAQDIAELLDTVEDDVKDAVIEQLDDSTREQVEALQAYGDDTVGRYMNPETVNVKVDVTLETVQRYIRILHLLDDHSQEIMVTDKENRLVGTLSLVDLVKNNQEALVSDFMYNSFSLLDEMDVHEAAMILRSKDLHFAPVVNECGILVGQLNIENILEITRDDSEATMMNMSGVSEDEELFAPIMRSAQSRGIWLGINLATAFLAAYVIGQFEAVLSQVVALAVLMPVVASMGGIAGSQTLTVIIRGLAMGQVGGNNRWWLFNKELWVGAMNGLLWAIVVGVIAQWWFEDTMISLVIALAILINMTVANIAGIAVPLVLKEMKIDPALSGAVILTTVTDVVGFMSFLGLATLLILK
ncbi:magnesium transporter [Thiosulfativibrio zosterae]|uniref:Magnesium transporter MgtE n=1 Tax=Thiosulfativibrio zosterae TaxID=2675053 RepID=A0A6F8PPC3_9GAMM|nr:magnesium transporter [Thiosulfativibrio zosterae]BBP43972.1 magnesium transporter MgtE [Thiosulfativibrio zosterae]